MCTLLVDRKGLDRQQQVVVDYLEEHNGWGSLKALSKYFVEKTGLRGRSTLNNVLIKLYEKDIAIRHKSYGKETIVTLVRQDETPEVLEDSLRRLALLFQEFKNFYDDPRLPKDLRIAFMYRLAYLIFLEGFHSSVISLRMNSENTTSSAILIKKLGELNQELLTFICEKFRADSEVSRLFVRQYPPLTGPLALELENLIDGLKSERSSAAPPKFARTTKSRKLL